MAPVPPETFEVDDVKPRWRSHWCFFCGNCTPSDCSASCIAYWVPCAAYGYTTSVAFRTSFWREVGRFFLIFGIVGLLNVLWGATQAVVCPVQVKDDGSVVATTTTTCMAMVPITQLLRLASIGCAVYWAWWVGGPRRTQLRNLLGIPDSGAGGDCCGSKGANSDACLHFWCLCCALAQEMRTVMHLNTTDKLPKAPPSGYEPLLSKAPEVTGSMSRAAAAGGGGGGTAAPGCGDAMV